MCMCTDGWIWEELNESMFVSIYMCVCLQIHTGMHVYRMQFLARFLSNKEYISYHRCERTNMAAK